MNPYLIPRIQTLSATVANQIAAGEVIERPASVVKELLENALDAKADTIVVEIGFGGLNQIKVCDNGVGILAEDLFLAVAAHATSKITELNDLYALTSMGFRGEALASIASVSCLSLTSKPEAQAHAMMLQVEGGSAPRTQPCARSQGTTVDVQNLFFNAPVRKKFLKSAQREYQFIERVVKQFALSEPSIGLTLKHNDQHIFTLPPAICEKTRELRVKKILGKPFVDHAIYLDNTLSSMRLQGWVCSPAYQRSQNDKQWLYVNQRMMKDKLIQHAIKRSYEDLLYPGRFPACLLYFSVAGNEVDVNVHPTKHEARFQNPRIVHDFISSTILSVLNKHAEIPKQSDSNQEHPSEHHSTQESVEEPNDQQSFVQFEILRSVDNIPKNFQYTSLKPVEGFSASPVCETYVPKPVQAFLPNQFSESFKSEWIIFNEQFGLIPINQQSYLVDMHAAHQEWQISRFNQQELPLKSRPLLVPVRYPIGKINAMQFEQCQAELAQLGLQIDLISDSEAIIRTLPLLFPQLNIKELLGCLNLNVNVKSFPDQNELLKIILHCQSFNAYQLTSEEKDMLGIYLSQNLSMSWCIPLNVENCREFLTPQKRGYTFS